MTASGTTFAGPAARIGACWVDSVNPQTVLRLCEEVWAYVRETRRSKLDWRAIGSELPLTISQRQALWRFVAYGKSVDINAIARKDDQAESDDSDLEDSGSESGKTGKRRAFDYSGRPCSPGPSFGSSNGSSPPGFALSQPSPGKRSRLALPASLASKPAASQQILSDSILNGQESESPPLSVVGSDVSHLVDNEEPPRGRAMTASVGVDFSDRFSNRPEDLLNFVRSSSWPIASGSEIPSRSDRDDQLRAARAMNSWQPSAVDDSFDSRPDAESSSRGESLFEDDGADGGGAGGNGKPSDKGRKARKMWSAQEDELLFLGIEAYGEGHWPSILAMGKLDRTTAQLSQRWTALKKRVREERCDDPRLINLVNTVSARAAAPSSGGGPGPSASLGSPPAVVSALPAFHMNSPLASLASPSGSHGSASSGSSSSGSSAAHSLAHITLPPSTGVGAAGGPRGLYGVPLAYAPPERSMPSVSHGSNSNNIGLLLESASLARPAHFAIPQSPSLSGHAFTFSPTSGGQSAYRDFPVHGNLQGIPRPASLNGDSGFSSRSNSAAELHGSSYQRGTDSSSRSLSANDAASGMYQRDVHSNPSSPGAARSSASAPPPVSPPGMSRMFRAPAQQPVASRMTSLPSHQSYPGLTSPPNPALPRGPFQSSPRNS